MEWWIPLTITGSNTGVCMSHTSNIRNQQDEENRGNNHETLRLLEEDTAADQRKTWKRNVSEMEVNFMTMTRSLDIGIEEGDN